MFNLNPAAMKPQSEFGREREGGRFTFIAITTGVYIVTILVVSSLVARATCPSVRNDIVRIDKKNGNRWMSEGG